MLSWAVEFNFWRHRGSPDLKVRASIGVFGMRLEPRTFRSGDLTAQIQ
jgi:hypothetical protein